MAAGGSTTQPGRRRRLLPPALILAGCLGAQGCGDPAERAALPATSDVSAPASATMSTAAPTSTTTTAPPVTSGAFSAEEGTALRVMVDGVPAELQATSLATGSDTIVVGTSQGGLYSFDRRGELLGASPTAHAGARIVGVGIVGETVISCSDDGLARTWDDVTDLESPAESTPLGGLAISAATVSLDGQWIAIAGINGRVAVFETTGLEHPVADVRVDGLPVALAFADSAIGDRPPDVAIGTAEGELLLARDGNEAILLGDRTESPLTSVTFVDQGTAVVRGGSTLPTRVEVETGHAETFDDGGASGIPITAVAAWRPEDATTSRIASAGSDVTQTSPAGSAASTSTSTSTWTSTPASAPAPGDDNDEDDRDRGVEGAEVAPSAVRLWTSAGDAPSSQPTRGFRGTVRHLAFLRDGSGLVIADSSRVRLRLIEG